ncbi:MAG: DinB family protein [Gemmatimonadaceae bacterium]
MPDFLSDAAIRERLDAERRALLERVAAIPPALREERPAPDRWSVAEVLDHLGRIEGGVRKLLEMKGAAPPPPDTPEPPADALLGPRLAALVRDRSRRIEAPERVRPGGGVPADEALGRLVEARERTIAAFAAADRAALDRVTHTHPVFGPLTLRSWVALTADHEARHAAQIGEIGEQVAARRATA